MPSPGKHVRRRDSAMVENEPRRIGAAHAELVELGIGGEAARRSLDDQRFERGAMRAVARPVALIGLARIDDDDVRVRAVRDPHLRAVQDVVVAVAARRRPHRRARRSRRWPRSSRARRRARRSGASARSRRCCSAVPRRAIMLTHRCACTAYESPTDADARLSSSTASTWPR